MAVVEDGFRIFIKSKKSVYFATNRLMRLRKRVNFNVHNFSADWKRKIDKFSFLVDIMIMVLSVIIWKLKQFNDQGRII